MAIKLTLMYIIHKHISETTAAKITEIAQVVLVLK